MSTELTQLELEVVQHDARLMPLGLELQEATTLEAWASIGKRLWRGNQLLMWWVGDWCAFGEAKYPGKLKEFAELNGFNYLRLKELGGVAAAVQLPLRKEGLDWAFYKEVAPLPKKEQSQWLKVAQEERLTVADLRERIRHDSGTEETSKTDKPMGLDCLRWRDCLVHWLKTRPPEFWSDERKEMWRRELGPIVQIYNSLGT